MLVDRILSDEPTVNTELISEKQLGKLKEYAQSSGVAIWGTGRAGKYAVDFCHKHNMQLTCVVDSFEHEKNSRFINVPLLSAGEFFAKFSDCLVIVACSYGYGIDKLLREKGVRYIVFDTNLLDQCIAAETYQNVILNSKEEIEKVYALLADGRSKYIFTQIIHYHLSLDLSYIEGLNDQPIYFNNDVIPSFSGDSFVDCGAYWGDTLLTFHRAKNCRCQTYYALEPSQSIFEQLKDTIQTHKIKDAVPMKIGAWDKTDVLYFADQHGGASNISNVGETSIQVDSLDHLFGDKNVDFIKMDIEGAERPAILGAKNIIQERTPYLAFSVYHKAQDLWRLPLLVNEINNNYRLYIRHHSPWGDDTVCYAVPQK